VPSANGVGERPYVKARRADEAHAKHAAAPFEDVESRCGNAHGLQTDRGVPAREIVGTIPVQLLGRVDGRLLQIRPAKDGDGVFDERSREVGDRPRFGAVHDLAGAIERRRRDTERDLRVVLLVGRGQELREARGFAEHERQHPRRQRIECTRVTDFHDRRGVGHRRSPEADRPPHHRDDVVRRRSCGLVDDDDAV
jgi:hypothetical protein